MAGVNFAVLGKKETCTGDPARRAGNEFLYQILSRENIETFKETFGDRPKGKKKVLGDPARLEEFCQLLRALPPGYNLKLHDWKKDHWCSSAKPAEIKEMLGHYTPGNHWLHVQRQLPKEDAVAMGPEAETWVRTSLLALLPLYRFTLWDPS